MVGASFYNSPLLVAVVVGVPAVLGILVGVRRAWRVDAIAELAGLATVQSGSIGQVFDGLTKNIDGLDRLVEALQVDNAALRTYIATSDDKLARIMAQCEELKRQLAELRGSL